MLAVATRGLYYGLCYGLAFVQRFPLVSPKSFDLIKISRWHPWAVKKIDTFLCRALKEAANEETY